MLIFSPQKGKDARENAEYLTDVINQLKAKMQELYADGTNTGYQAAYQGMNDVGRSQSSNASNKQANKLKNRYHNILAYDRTRVVLPVINDDPDTDYVNANYIAGYKNPKAYIASQGPVPNSFIGYWRMIWQEQV